jgi:hypothetical protein
VRVTLEDWTTRLAKWLGITREIEVGDRDFDERFLLETEKRAPAKQMLVNREVRHAIHTVFTNGVRELKIGGRTVQARLPVNDFSGMRRTIILRELEALAGALERPPLAVAVLAGEHRAATDKRGKARCPYCRDGLTGEEPDLVACRQCETVLHDECWRELGRCPVLGCRGRQPQRARRRR